MKEYDNYFLNTIDKRPIKIVWLGKFDSWAYCNKLNSFFNTDIHIVGNSLLQLKNNSLPYYDKEDFDLLIYYSDELSDENVFNELLNQTYMISKKSGKDIVVVYYGKTLKTNGSNVSSKILIQHIKDVDANCFKCIKDLDTAALLDISAAMYDELRTKRKIKELCKIYKTEIE